MSVLTAARTLGERSAWQLTNLEMQKILYVAHMLHMGRTGTPLFEEPFEAWEYGPVVPSLYRLNRAHGRNRIPAFKGELFAPDMTEYDAIADALAMTNHMTPGQLIAYTHRVGGAWEKHYREGDGIISDRSIMEEFQQHMLPSDEAVAWAEAMADEIAQSPSRYLDSENERAFRARVLSANFH